MRHHTRSQSTILSTLPLHDWIKYETSGCIFPDARLCTRFKSLLGMMAHGIGESIPAACQDWANTKAAYRFFANKRVTTQQILDGHIQSTQQRCTAAAAPGPLLILQDTTEVTCRRRGTQNVGLLRTFQIRPKLHRIPLSFRLHDFLMHSSLVLTTNGLPLGLAAVKFWERKRFKYSDALKRRINPTRVPIEQKESYRWLEHLRASTQLVGRPSDCVHIGDREADIYELFALAQDLETNFLVRTCVDRLAKEGETAVEAVMKRCPWAGTYKVESRAKDGKPYEATLQIRFRRLLVQPPVGKEHGYEPHEFTIIHAVETSKPKGRERIEWKLITNLPVNSLNEAREKLGWYGMRWKIEVYHKILKSGCKAEQSKLRTTRRLMNQVALYCLIAWRVFWMTMVRRESRPAPARAAFTVTEINLLDALVQHRRDNRRRKADLESYITKLARLGGYLARTHDPPPGNMVVWRGLSRLNDIQ
ncbi:MAG: IS4 family transposase, partial [Verrucomicrobia bacterium]|nr:IS4 family transposase [Verrucomicrobiota bacterium]